MTKKTQISYASRGPIRHAYDAVLTRLARLAAFSSCSLLTDWGEVDQRLEDLATDDLIALAIHLRRLLELTGHKELASQVTIRGLVKSEIQQLPVTRIANGLIHHTSLSIARRKADTLPLPNEARSESWTEWHTAFQVGINPMAWLASDEIVFLAFPVGLFAAAVAKDVLVPIVEYCDAGGLYLENDDVD